MPTDPCPHEGDVPPDHGQASTTGTQGSDRLAELNAEAAEAEKG